MNQQILLENIFKKFATRMPQSGIAESQFAVGKATALLKEKLEENAEGWLMCMIHHQRQVYILLVLFFQELSPFQGPCGLG